MGISKSWPYLILTIQNISCRSRAKVSLKAVPISIINYLVELNHIYDSNLIRNWALGNSPRLLRGRFSLPLPNPHYFLISSTLTLLRDIIKGTHCTETQATEGDFCLSGPHKHVCQKEGGKVPTDERHGDGAKALWKNRPLAFCCYERCLPGVLPGPVKIQVVCSTTWVKSPFSTNSSKCYILKLGKTR